MYCNSIEEGVVPGAGTRQIPAMRKGKALSNGYQGDSEDISPMSN